jgi:hypothetical protein
MAGIIVELIISWLLLWFVCKRHLSVLGFRPTKSRVTNFGIGLLIATSCCTLYQIMTTAFINNGWALNKQVTGKINIGKFKMDIRICFIRGINF